MERTTQLGSHNKVERKKYKQTDGSQKCTLEIGRQKERKTKRIIEKETTEKIERLERHLQRYRNKERETNRMDKIKQTKGRQKEEITYIL